MSRIESWSGSRLNQAGRYVMLKSVGLTILLYVMSCFKLPDGLCAELNSVMASFKSLNPLLRI